MGYVSLPEDEQVKATNRNIWLLLTAVFTFISGTYAAKDEWMVFWAMIGVWAFVGLLLAVCNPGGKRLR
jgi:hypothetical protein